MAKLIEYSDGIEAMRGSLSPRQTLVYAQDNNPAYYSPVGQRNAARNYKTNFIGMKDNATGRTRFAVRNKYAINMTSAAKQAMALLGATAGTLSAWLQYYDTEAAHACYDYQIAQGLIPDWMTFRQFWFSQFRSMLSAGTLSEDVETTGGYSITIGNPFLGPQVMYPPKPLTFVKFFTIFNSTGFYFTIDGHTGVGDTSMTFASIIGSQWNVLELASEAHSPRPLVMFHDRYVLDETNTYVIVDRVPTSGQKFHTTSNPPA